MRNIRCLFVLLVLVSLASCRPEHKGTAVVTGRLPDGSGTMLTLEEIVLTGMPYSDSLKAGSDGFFRFDLSPKETGFYALKTADGRMTILILAPGDTLDIQGTWSGFPVSTELAGPEDAVLLHNFYRKGYARKAIADSLQAVLVENRNDSLFATLCMETDTIFDSIWESQRKDGIAFLREHPGSFASLIVVDYSFGVRNVLSMEQDLACYKAVDSALSIRFPGNPHVLFLHKKIADFERRQKLTKVANP